MSGRAYRLVVAGVAASLAVVLVSCGSSGTSSQTARGPATNGLENQAAAQVAQAAHAALKTATSVHVRGIITAGDRAYLKADKRGWRAMGNPDTTGLPLHQWVTAGPARQMLTPFSLASLASELTAEESAHGGGGTVTQSMLAGHKVVVVTYPDGSKLYVANVGTAYPLRFDDTGAVGSRTFSQYGAAFHITAPPRAGH